MVKYRVAISTRTTLRDYVLYLTVTFINIDFTIPAKTMLQIHQ